MRLRKVVFLLGDRGNDCVLRPATRPFFVELPGIETDALLGKMPSELRFRSIPFRFSPARYLRVHSRVLTA